MNSSDEPLDPRAAGAEIDRASERVRRGRWWYVAASALMAAYTAAFYIGFMAFPTRLADFVLPSVILMLAVLALLSWRQRMTDRGASRIEGRVVWSTIGIGTVAMLLNEFVIPDGLGVWTVLVGLLPAVPFAVLAWRVARR